MVDDCTRQCLGARGRHFAVRPASRARARRHRAPARSGDDDRSDNGSEFTSNAILGWADESGVGWNYIAPSKPQQNGFIESFNGRLRDELLNETLFRSLPHARAVLEAWRRDFNEERPHSKLGWMTPRAYAGAILEIAGRSAAQTDSSALRPLETAIDDGSDHHRTLASVG